MLCIDVASQTVYTVGGGLSGFEKWEGGVLAADGAMYCIPLKSKYILKINPEGDGVAVQEEESAMPTMWNKGAAPAAAGAEGVEAGAAGAAGAAAAGVLFYSGPSSASAREALVVRRSVDGGATWDARHLVDPGPSGYSCLVAPLPLAIGCDEASGGACGGVLYEADNLVIRFARFPLVF